MFQRKDDTPPEEKAKRRAIMGKILSSFGKALPKGIRHPDSLVRNAHLYKPTPGKHTTRLYYGVI
jgi:hypothetical protein